MKELGKWLRSGLPVGVLGFTMPGKEFGDVTAFVHRRWDTNERMSDAFWSLPGLLTQLQFRLPKPRLAILTLTPILTLTLS